MSGNSEGDQSQTEPDQLDSANEEGSSKAVLVRKTSAPQQSTSNSLSPQIAIPIDPRRMSAIGIRRASSRYPTAVFAYPLPLDSSNPNRRPSHVKVEIPAHLLLNGRHPSSVSDKSTSSIKKFLQEQQEILEEQQRHRGTIPFLPGFSLCGAVLLGTAALALFVLLLTQSGTNETKLCGGESQPPRVS